MSLLVLAIKAGIPGDVVWSLIDGKHIVSVSHYDRLHVDRVDNEIDVMAADFAMRSVWLH